MASPLRRTCMLAYPLVLPPTSVMSSAGSAIVIAADLHAASANEQRTMTLIASPITFLSSRRRHTRYWRDWSSDVCSSDLVDVLLGPEMRSTGEVIGLDRSFGVAFAKSQLGGGVNVPKTGTVFVSVRDADKPRILPAVRMLAELGFRILATGGTQRFLEENGVKASRINKVLEGRPHVVDAIKNGEIQLVFNTTEGAGALSDSRSLRRAALLHKVPYYTTLAGAVAAAEGIKAYQGGDLQVRRLQDYFG